MKVLEVEDLNVQYKSGAAEKKQNDFVVRNISFAVEEGEIVGVVGASGAGKSTAMLAVMGLLREGAAASAGKLAVCGEAPAPGKNISMIFQDSLSCLNPSVRIGRQITETVRNRKKCGRREARERAEELLDMVGLKDIPRRMRQYPFELSGGMRQRVVIAIALACEPKVIIADEPVTALDAVVQAQILNLLKRIARTTKTALLLVSHDLGVTAALCERVYVMKKGRIEEEGLTADVFYAPQKEYTRQLLKDAGVRTEKGKEKEHTEKEYTKKEHTEKEVLLRVERAAKAFGREGVRDVSLTIRKGETFALAGESGSGKTTLAKLITGILPPDSGQVYLKEAPMYGQGKKKGAVLQKADGKLQMIFQDPYAALNPCFTAGEALEEALRAQKETGDAQREGKTEKIFRRTGLTKEDMKKFPSGLSGGERQRVGIARALVTEPELLVCDEALSALDATTQAQVMDILMEEQRERKTALLFISHDIRTVSRLSGGLGVMYMGSLVETGITKEVCASPWHPYTKQLLEAVPSPDPLRAGRIKAVFPKEEKNGENTSEEAAGCPFAPRCGYAFGCCHRETPKLYAFENRSVRCFLYSEKHSGKRGKHYKMTSQI